jgi:hypothetical protein
MNELGMTVSLSRVDNVDERVNARLLLYSRTMGEPPCPAGELLSLPPYPRC